MRSRPALIASDANDPDRTQTGLAGCDRKQPARERPKLQPLLPKHPLDRVGEAALAGDAVAEFGHARGRIAALAGAVALSLAPEIGARRARRQGTIPREARSISAPAPGLPATLRSEPRHDRTVRPAPSSSAPAPDLHPTTSTVASRSPIASRRSAPASKQRSACSMLAPPSPASGCRPSRPPRSP
jgi:hypothetical protein